MSKHLEALSAEGPKTSEGDVKCLTKHAICIDEWERD